MQRNKRLLMLALPVMAILLCFILYEYVYVGVMAKMASISEQQDVKMQTLKRYVSLIAEKPELEKQLVALKERVKTDRGKLIEGDPISLASANLQGLVKGIVTGRGGTISSERIGQAEELEKAPVSLPGNVAPTAKAPATKKSVKAPEGPKLQVLSVSIDATLPDTAAMSDILYSIETRMPYLVVKELDVRVRNFRDPRDLMVRIDVTGLYGGK